MFCVESENLKLTQDHILSKYTLQNCKVKQSANGWTVKPLQNLLNFKTKRSVSKLGILVVGWGGNNGTTLTASLLANKRKLQWNTKNGTKTANYYGSLTQSSTIFLGTDETGKSQFIPFHQILPMLDPSDILVHGWDIRSRNLADAMKDAKVLDWDLQSQLMNDMKEFKPMPSAYSKDFIALNQFNEADNVIHGTKAEQLHQLRLDIRNFKLKHQLDQVIVVWTASTERFCDVMEGVHDTSVNVLKAIESNHSEISPSTLFAVASILEHVPFINGSPQNTFVPGVIELSMEHKVSICGDDFKSGQTKFKSVLVDFLVNAGIKPIAVTSYNHLGNNDGKNLSEPLQFRSKEISKRNVIDDIVESNSILYPNEKESPNHTVVIKYVPAVGDSKRALDEYVSDIFMGGQNIINVYQICEDSLLACPLILDLVILTELFNRIQWKLEEDNEFKPMHSILSFLSYFFKAPLVEPGNSAIHSLYRQRQGLENILKACSGLPLTDSMLMRHFH